MSTNTHPLDTEALLYQIATELVYDRYPALTVEDDPELIDTMKPLAKTILTLITVQKESWQREARIDELEHCLPYGSWIRDKSSSISAILVKNRINELKKEGK